MVESFLTWLVDFVHALGYWGIVLMTFLESTFAPIPSEATMVPVGYLIQQGHMNLWIAYGCSVVGTLLGSLANYYLAVYLGRPVLARIGKYMFLEREKLEYIEQFFAKHGEISIFTGRLIPGVRHVISFPAGLARMDVKKFSIYTTLGGSLWMAVLIAVGYFIGDNKELVKQFMPIITACVVGSVIFMIGFYIYRMRKSQRAEADNGVA